MAVHNPNGSDGRTGLTTTQNVDLSAGSAYPAMTLQEATLGVSRNVDIPESALIGSMPGE